MSARTGAERKGGSERERVREREDRGSVRHVHAEMHIGEPDAEELESLVTRIRT